VAIKVNLEERFRRVQESLARETPRLLIARRKVYQTLSHVNWIASWIESRVNWVLNWVVKVAVCLDLRQWISRFVATVKASEIVKLSDGKRYEIKPLIGTAGIRRYLLRR